MHRPTTPTVTIEAQPGDPATSGSILTTPADGISRAVPIFLGMLAVVFAVVTFAVNQLPWPHMPYQRPPMVVNIVLVAGAALFLALAALCWIGADLMHRIGQVDARVARIEERLGDGRAANDGDTVRIQQPTSLRSGGRVYFGGLARSQIDALAQTVMNAVQSRLDTAFDAVDQRVEALDVLLSTGQELKPAAGGENTPPNITWLPVEQRGSNGRRRS